MLLGPTPPPYGGITSLIEDLLPHLAEKSEIDIVTPSHAQKGNKFPLLKPIITHAENRVKTHFYNHKTIAILRLFPLCSQLLRFVFALLMSERSASMNLLKTIAIGICNEYAIGKVTRKESQAYNHVILFGLNYIGCVPYLRRHFGNSTKITLMIFAEAYKWPDSYLRASEYFRKRLSVVDNIYSSSDYCACSLKKVLGLDDYVSTIYIGVDTDLFRPVSAIELKNRLNIPSDSKIILALSRMNEEMGYDVVLRAAEELLEKNNNLYFIMAGARADYTEQVLEFCSNHKRAICQVNVPIQEKVFYYSMADIFLAPTERTHACMGVSIKEAMACQTPIVASSSGGIPEAINHRKNGCLVGFKNKKTDVDALVSEAQFLLDNPDISSSLAEQARADAEFTFSTAAMFKKYDDLLS